MAKKPVSTGMGVGSSSILVIFILLCLTTFATLSLMSASADLRLTEKSVAAVQDYYYADAMAEEILAQIDRVLQQPREQALDLPALRRLTALQVEEQVPQVTAQGSGTDLSLLYQVPLNENQTLFVDLAVQFDEERYQIRRWAVAYTGQWEAQSDGFQLWDGDEAPMVLADGGLPF